MPLLAPHGQATPVRIAGLLLAGLLLAACVSQDNASQNESQNSSDDNGPGPHPESGLDRQTLTVGDQEILVELATTHRSRQQGLMFRETLPADEGMLFVYPRPGPLSFWMKNTLIPLDIAYIDSDGTIVDIQSMEPLSTDSYPAPVSIPYALEMNQGWFRAQEIQEGDQVQDLPPLSIAR